MMIASPYKWSANSGGKYCVLTSLENVTEPHEIAFGKSRFAGFPADAQYKMSKEFKKQVALADNLWSSGHRVISAKIKALVEARNPVGVEFLPVRILDHKGHVASADYFILHPILLVDCVDKKKSDLKWNRINPELISAAPTLEFDLTTIPKDAMVWRPKHLEFEIFVRRELADEVTAAGCTGLEFTELADYGG